MQEKAGCKEAFEDKRAHPFYWLLSANRGEAQRERRRTTVHGTRTQGEKQRASMGSGAGATIQTKEKLVGAANFKRVNPLSDRFDVK